MAGGKRGRKTIKRNSTKIRLLDKETERNERERVLKYNFMICSIWEHLAHNRIMQLLCKLCGLCRVSTNTYEIEESLYKQIRSC